MFAHAETYYQAAQIIQSACCFQNFPIEFYFYDKLTNIYSN